LAAFGRLMTTAESMDGRFEEDILKLDPRYPRQGRGLKQGNSRVDRMWQKKLTITGVVNSISNGCFSVSSSSDESHGNCPCY